MKSTDNEFIHTVAVFIEQWIKPFFQFIIHLRLQTAIALAVYLLFSKVEQAVEIYRSIALDESIYKAVVATSSIAILGVFIWYTARFLVLEQFNTKNQANQCQVWLANWGPRCLGIVPVLGLCLGLFEAWQQSISAEAKLFLIVWLMVSLSVGIAIFLLFVFRTVLFHQFFFGSKTQGKGLFNPAVEIGLANSAYIVFGAFSLPLIAAVADSKISLGLIIILLFPIPLNLLLYSWHSKQKSTIDKITLGWCIAALLISLIFVFTLPATAMPSLVGTIGVAAIAFTILLVVFSTIYNWALNNNIPALSILIGLVVFSSIFNLNDNHRFRQSVRPQDSLLPSLEDSFKLWLASRPDRDQYAGTPYPVYLASAQGGGIYAAYHAATTFAKLTEYMPSFPQHVFAISSVSGGSLGGTTFASLVKESGGDSATLSEKVDKIFEQDLLSPLLAIGLFPDLIQRFIPFSIYGWDRANGLEIAFENAWDKLSVGDRENPFKRSFYQHWQPQGVAPALVLNTTIVENGRRLAISPFKIKLPNQENIALDESSLDLRLSTAAGLSARFPFVTPVGWYKRSSDGSKLRLADGGYFDNSGIPTAIDIGRALQKIEGYGKSFKVIYLAIVDQQEDSSMKSLKSAGLNEIWSPIQTLFSAREARSQSAIELSAYTLNDGITDPFKLAFRTIVLQKVSLEKQIKLPLGWQLATTSKEFIYGQAPNPSQCRVESFQQTFGRHTADPDVQNHNSCVAKSIADDLS